jgi:hypothetical protein
MTFDEWLKFGWEHGWCSPPVCSTHDGVPMSDEEDEAIFDGDDRCIPVMRLYESADVAAEVVASHPPTVWRATNRWGQE